MPPGNHLFRNVLLAGLLPGIVAPLLWPAVVYLAAGRLPAWHTYPSAALAMAFVAVLVGLSVAAFIGFPVLLALRRYRLNRPWLAALIGALLAVILAYVYGPWEERSGSLPTWPVYLFMLLLGALCGATASLLTREDA
jgi:hypothetical protein